MIVVIVRKEYRRQPALGLENIDVDETQDRFLNGLYDPRNWHWNQGKDDQEG
jgi:hypothetical protein